MKKCLPKLVVLLLLASAPAVAQTVSGRVTNSADGSALPGVSVLVKGTTTGTTTDTDGKYAINASDPANSVLVFSFIGFASQEVQVNNRTSIDINLAEDITQLGEVVVTALGIERDKKSLGYSVQEVDGTALTTAREANLVNSLAGRVAGVQIYKAGTGPGGSSRIVIRGNNSLGGNNQPLVVVDGIPMENQQTANNQSEFGSTDQGNGIQEINPDDIETMSVLKGPAAAALYGTRGGNGVILVTTKKGKARSGLGISFNSNLTFDTPLMLPDVQNEYGQGINGTFDPIGGSSWGPKITGQSVTDWTGQTRPMTADPDDLKNFLETGKSFTNSVDLSGGNDNTTFRIGYTNYDNKGLLPNTSIKRNQATLRLSSKLTSKFSADSKFSYSRQDGKNRSTNSGNPSNIFAQYSLLPRSVHITDMKPWVNSNGGMVLWRPSAYSTLRNPYWVLYEDFNFDQSDRFLTMVKLDYNITDWLKVFVRHGMDQRQLFTEGANAYGINDSNFNSGYAALRSRSSETNADFLVTATKTFGDLNVSLSAGGNQLRSTYNSVSGSTGLLDLPGVYNLSSGSFNRPSSYKSEIRLNSLYTFLNVAYKSFLYVDATFRNDWSSTLSPENRSFSYPSVSASVVLSDLLESSLPAFISYAKVRGGYAEAGNTIGAYSLEPTYTIGRGFLDAIVTSPPRTRLEPNILPEIVKSSEAGLDMKFLDDRFGFEFTYYKKNAFNQILLIQVPGATGFGSKYVNGGNLQNAGYEFTLNASPAKSTDGFNWDIAVNYNHNKNTVEELHPEIKLFQLQSDVSSRAVRILAEEGKGYGNIYGRDFLRDTDGNILVTDAGIPLKSNDKNVLLGNYQPKFTMGIINNLSFKSISLGFLIDWREGGEFYSQTLAFMHGAGTATGTVANREGGLIVPGKKQSDGTTNATAITAQEYWGAVSGAEPVASLFVYDASNIRLRELTLSFNVPANALSKLPIKRLSFGFVGRNLWLIKSDAPGIDPESSFTTTNAQGYENGAYPSYRSYGFNLNVGF